MSLKFICLHKAIISHNNNSTQCAYNLQKNTGNTHKKTDTNTLCKNWLFMHFFIGFVNEFHLVPASNHRCGCSRPLPLPLHRMCPNAMVFLMNQSWKNESRNDFLLLFFLLFSIVGLKYPKILLLSPARRAFPLVNFHNSSMKNWWYLQLVMLVHFRMMFSFGIFPFFIISMTLFFWFLHCRHNLFHRRVHLKWWPNLKLFLHKFIILICLYRIYIDRVPFRHLGQPFRNHHQSATRASAARARSRVGGHGRWTCVHGARDDPSQSGQPLLLAQRVTFHGRTLKVHAVEHLVGGIVCAWKKDNIEIFYKKNKYLKINSTFIIFINKW